MNLKSVMQHNFSAIPSANIQRSVFNRSCGHKSTFDAGNLIPVFRDDALPGDTFVMNATMYARLASPLYYPIMDNMYLDIHWFSIPYRLLWTNFVHFMGEKHNPGDANLSTTYLMPTVTSPAITGWTAESLFDYLGVPIGVPGKAINALYSRAYNLVYNTWYKAEDIIDDAVVDVDDGPDTASDYVIRKRGKRFDYFTSGLPYPQFGATTVALPLGTTAPLQKISNVAQASIAYQVGTNTAHASDEHIRTHAATGGLVNDAKTFNLYLDNHDAMEVDLSGATAANINELREALATQHLLEQWARGGHRYCEVILSCFGVRDPQHAVLQRPEYLGGTSSAVKVTPVANTSSTATEKQGNLAAIGTVAVTSGFTKSFTEHCVILGIASVRCDLTYQQGLERAFSKSTRYDYYWPAFANLGEQSILTQEIYCDASGTDDDVFAYQEAYAEYRYKQSLISGKMRSTYATPLDAWHLSQEFGAAPTLSKTFIEETPPMSRVKSVSTEPDFVFDSYYNLKCARPMPVYSVPGLRRL